MVLRRTVRIQLIVAIVFVCNILSFSVAQEDILEFISWHPDGILLAKTQEFSIEIIDTSTMTTLNTLSNLPPQSTGAKWSPSGQKLAISYGDKVQIWDKPWDSTNGTLTTTITFPSQQNTWISTIAWKPSIAQTDQIIAIGSRGRILLWDIYNSSPIYSGDPSLGSIRQIEWSPNGTQIAITAMGHFIYIWNGDMSEQLGAMLIVTSDNLPTSEDRASAFGISWDSSGMQIAYAVSDGTGRIWDTANLNGDVSRSSADDTTSKVISSEPILATDWNPVNNLIVSGGKGGMITVWNPITFETIETISVGRVVYSVAWSPDGSQLATVASDGTVQIVPAPAIVSCDTTIVSGDVTGQER